MSTQITLWLLCLTLFSCSALVVYANCAVIYLAHFKGKHISQAGLAGGALCSLALWLQPLETVQRWFWVPLVVDPGCLFLACALVYVLIFRRALP
jgi:hypothetical protein